MNFFKYSRFLLVALVVCASISLSQASSKKTFKRLAMASLAVKLLKPQFVPLPVPFPLPIKLNKNVHKNVPIHSHSSSHSSHFVPSHGHGLALGSSPHGLAVDAGISAGIGHHGGGFNLGGIGYDLHGLGSHPVGDFGFHGFDQGGHFGGHGEADLHGLGSDIHEVEANVEDEGLHDYI